MQPPAPNEAVTYGRCRGMTSALQDLLERHVASGTVPGVVASLGTAELEIVAAGAMSVGGAPMRVDGGVSCPLFAPSSRGTRPFRGIKECPPTCSFDCGAGR